MKRKTQAQINREGIVRCRAILEEARKHVTVDYGDVYPHVTGTCHWCGEYIVNGAREAGAPPGTIDWMTDGDYGCVRHPITNSEDGTGPHETWEDVVEIVRRYHRIAEVVPTLCKMIVSTK